MGYIMRYITGAARAVSLADIETALRQSDAAYAIVNTDIDDMGDLMYGDRRLGIIEINRPGEDIFEDDIAEFRDLVGGQDTPEQRRVLETLDHAQAIIAVEAIWPGAQAEPTLSRLDPLWDWLFATYPGLLQADNEGFYEGDELVLARRFTL